MSKARSCDLGGPKHHFVEGHRGGVNDRCPVGDGKRGDGTFRVVGVSPTQVRHHVFQGPVRLFRVAPAGAFLNVGGEEYPCRRAREDHGGDIAPFKHTPSPDCCPGALALNHLGSHLTNRGDDTGRPGRFDGPNLGCDILALELHRLIPVGAGPHIDDPRSGNRNGVGLKLRPGGSVK